MEGYDKFAIREYTDNFQILSSENVTLNQNCFGSFDALCGLTRRSKIYRTMKKFFVIALLMVCVNTVMGQIFIRNNGETSTLSFGGVYVDVPSSSVPFVNFLRPNEPLIPEVAIVAREKTAEWMHDYGALETAMRVGQETRKLTPLLRSLKARKSGAASNDSNYEARKKADAHKAAQEYAAKRNSSKPVEFKISTKADSSHTTTTTTGSFSSGM